jgi:hypothetical protein
MVKPDVDVLLTMPVAPPADGGAAGPPPGGRLSVAVGEGVAVAERAERDDTDAADAPDAPTPVSPATAHVSPAATIHPPLFFDGNHRALDRRACTARVDAADPADEWRVGS